MTAPLLTIRPAGLDDLPAFFAYLNDHLSDNGRGDTALFMPMPRAASVFPPERQDAFRGAVAAARGQPGWRRLWLAWSEEGEIAGHIDLRLRGKSFRAMPGMTGNWLRLTL